MLIKHFVFFRNGKWIREWKGLVEEPKISYYLTGESREMALNAWATKVSCPEPGEIGLDVTHIDWPVGDFCYCTFDESNRTLDWGPLRYYIEVNLDTLKIISNTISHRPIHDEIPNQHVIDITGTDLEQFHGKLFGRFIYFNGNWKLISKSNDILDLNLNFLFDERIKINDRYRDYQGRIQ